MAIWNILPIFGIFYDHLVHFVLIWYIFTGFGIMYLEKSGKPGLVHLQLSALTRAWPGWTNLDCIPTICLAWTVTGSFIQLMGKKVLCKHELFAVPRPPETGWPGTDVMIFKIFSPKNLAKKLAFLLKLLLVFCKNCDHNIVFWEKRQFFRRKLSKISENFDHNIDPGYFSEITAQNEAQSLFDKFNTLKFFSLWCSKKKHHNLS
jgi:hypothetical protein